MHTIGITHPDYSDIPAPAHPLTPEQAHAIVCAGGIQPHSITPEAALASLLANRAAVIRQRRAHGLADDHQYPPPARKEETPLRVPVPHSPHTLDILRAVRRAEASAPHPVIFFQPRDPSCPKSSTLLDKATSTRLSVCAAILKAANSPVLPSSTSRLQAAQSAVALLPATYKRFANEFAFLCNPPSPAAIPLGQALALGVEAQEAVLLARQSVQPEGAAPASTISREVWAKAFPNNPLP